MSTLDDLTRKTLESRGHFCVLYPYLTNAALLATEPWAAQTLIEAVEQDGDLGSGMAQTIYDGLSHEDREAARHRAQAVGARRVGVVVERVLEACSRARFNPADLDPDTLAVVALAWPETLVAAPAGPEAA